MMGMTRIDHHQVRREVLENLERTLAILGRLHFATFLLEDALQARTSFSVIVDNQYA